MQDFISDYIKAKNEVISFLNKNFKNLNIEEQLNKLKDYNFTQLAIEQNCDEDSTDIVKSIYFIIWHDVLPKLSSFDEMNEYYGGETLNTFNTLFQKDLYGIKKFYTESEAPNLYKKIQEFGKNYVTIGNFMLLPKKTLNNMSINQEKGSYKNSYKDFFDLFAVALFQSDDFNELKKINDFYFSKIDEKSFCEINFLDDYFEDNKFKIIFKHCYEDNKYYPYYHWKYKNPILHKDEYKTFIEDYIETTTKIIEHRAEKICEKLKERL